MPIIYTDVQLQTPEEEQEITKTLTVRHSSFGERHVSIARGRVMEESESYVKFLDDNGIRHGLQCLELARELILDQVPYLASCPHFVALRSDGVSDIISLLCHSVAYLIHNEVRVIGDDYMIYSGLKKVA